MRPNLQVLFAAPWQVELVERPIPTPGAGEVLIETQRSLISSGTEMTLLSGEAWSPLATPGQSLPAVGYCNVGVVIDVGVGVDRSWLGRRVASRSIHVRYASCAVEASAGQWRSGVFAIPDHITDDDATLFALGITALHGVRLGRLHSGESVAVVGLGLLGQLVVRDALRRGAARVLAVGRGRERLAFLPRHDALQPLAGGIERVASDLAASGTPGVDLALEVSGDPAAVAAALRLVRPGGRLVLLGSARGASTLDLQALCVAPSRTIIGAHISSLPAQPISSDDWCVAEAARVFFGAVEPALRTGPSLITHRFQATDAARAYAHLRDPRDNAMGCILDWIVE